MPRYEPNDSPFGDAFRYWAAGNTLRVYGSADLDEFASCAAHIAHRYPDDERLVSFQRECSLVIREHSDRGL